MVLLHTRHAHANQPSRTEYVGSTPLAQLVLRSLAHVWAKDGTHLGWRTVDELQHEASKLGELGRSQAGHYRKVEKDAFDKGGGFRTRPNVFVQFMESRAKHEALLASIADEPESTVGGNKFKFNPVWYRELNERLKKYDGIGSGVRLAILSCEAAAVYKKNTGFGPDWVPSETWCVAIPVQRHSHGHPTH
jgi:hypothetical protein